MTADIVWKTTDLPDAILGIAYQAGLGFTGAASAVTAASATTGALPTGLVCNASDHVRVTGTPTALGLFTFKISLTDSAGVVESGSMTINVRDVALEDGAGLTAADKVTAEISKLRWP